MNIKSIFSLGLLTFSVLFLVSCSNDGNGNDNVTGQFIDDSVEGLEYQCSSAVDFPETTANGEFTCPAGDNVTFYLKTNQLGPVPATTSVVTPYTLFPNDPPAAINLARLLQSIDKDGDPDNGVIVVDDALVLSLPDNIDFSSPTFTDDIENALGITLVSAEQAEQTLNDAIAQYVQDNQPGKHAPVSNAGGDQSVSTGATVNLSGSGSSDADGDTLNYYWSIESRPLDSNAALVLPNNLSTTFVADTAGVYVITLTVYDGISINTDTVSITAIDSGGADLSALSLSAGTFSPTFDPSTINYATTVDNATDSTTVTPTTSDTNATVTVNDITVTSGSASTAIDLSVGTNAITVVVTAEDGSTSKAYTVTVTRLESVPDIPVAPQGLQATAGDSEVALSWNTTSGASSYKVYWNTTGSVSISDSSIDAGIGTQVTHSSLTNDTTYYYRVAASNVSGEGALSSEASATPTEPATDYSVTISPGDGATVNMCPDTTTFTANVTGGDSPYSYSWSVTTTSGAGFDVIDPDNEQEAEVCAWDSMTEGTIEVTVTDGSSNQITTNIYVTVF